MTRQLLIRVQVPDEGEPTVELVDSKRPGPLPSSIPGPACPVHLRELVRVNGGVTADGRPFPASWRCTTFGCNAQPLWDARAARGARRERS